MFWWVHESIVYYYFVCFSYSLGISYFSLPLRDLLCILQANWWSQLFLVIIIEQQSRQVPKTISIALGRVLLIINKNQKDFHKQEKWSFQCIFVALTERQYPATLKTSCNHTGLVQEDPALKSCKVHWCTFVNRPAACLWSSHHFYRALSKDGAPTCGLLMGIHWHDNLVQLASTHILERYLVQWALYRHYFMHIHTSLWPASKTWWCFYTPGSVKRFYS